MIAKIKLKLVLFFVFCAATGKERIANMTGSGGNFDMARDVQENLGACSILMETGMGSQCLGTMRQAPQISDVPPFWRS